MTPHTTARLRAELAAARQGLRAVADMVAEGREAFVASVVQQRALAFCWVATGSALKHYARLADLRQGHGPLAPAIHFRDRIAHQPLDRLDPTIIWETSVHDAPELLRVVERRSVKLVGGRHQLGRSGNAPTADLVGR